MTPSLNYLRHIRPLAHPPARPSCLLRRPSESRSPVPPPIYPILVPGPSRADTRDPKENRASLATDLCPSLEPPLPPGTAHVWVKFPRV